MNVSTKWARTAGKILIYLPLIALIILIGLYPLQFFMSKDPVGILTMKSETLLADVVWKAFFNMHIVFGGIALLIGWIQFNRYIRTKWRTVHRWLGIVYVLSAWLSVLGVGYISFYAEGGIIAFLGFVLGGMIWFYTTIQGYATIRKGLILKHQQWMTFSYAMCLGAVALRVWLPLLSLITTDFIFSYQLVSWISWVPNLIVAYFITRRQATITGKSLATQNPLVM